MALRNTRTGRNLNWETWKVDITLKSLMKLHPRVSSIHAEERLRAVLSDPAVPLVSALAQVCDEVQADGALREGTMGDGGMRPGGSLGETAAEKTSVAGRRAGRRRFDFDGASSSSGAHDGCGLDQVDSHAGSPVSCKPPRVFQWWCEYFLSTQFPKVSLPVLRLCLIANNWRIGPAYTSLLAELSPADDVLGKGEVEEMADRRDWVPVDGLQLLKCGRRNHPKGPPTMKCDAFARDCERMLLDWIARRTSGAETKAQDRAAVVDVKEQVLRDADLAMALNRQEEEEEAARRKAAAECCTDIDCGCCYASFPFEQLAQCADGHLFCFDCLQRRVKELTFGGSNLHPEGKIQCMEMGGCSHVFPWTEVRRAVPAKIMDKYEQRLGEHCVMKALAEVLFRCPFCNFPVEVDTGLQVCDCPKCHKRSCTLCKQPSHYGLRCEDVEKKPETDFRLTVEEEMTRAVLRTCGACKAELMKTEGCNKVTCRCGHVMCYVCRATITDYTHFCPHLREPQKKCKLCSLCSLWEQEDVESVASDARNHALKEAVRSNPDLGKRPIAWLTADLAGSQSAKQGRHE